MRLVLQNVLWILVFVAYQYICLANSGVNVGVFLDQEDDQSEVSLNSTLLRRNVYDRKTHFDSTVKRLSNFESGFDVSKILCEVLGTGNGVGAVIDTTSEPISDVLHSICTDFEVPYISTRWRSTSSKSQTTFNFFPMADIFQEGLAEIVKSLGWNSFVVIYESDEGLIKLQEVLKLQAYSSETKRNSILLKQLGPGMDHRTLLKEVKNSTENNILLDCRTENIIPILQQAKNLDLLNLHYNYFITSLDAHTLESDFANLDATANITTIRLFDYTNEKVSQTIRNWNQYSKDEIGYPPNMIKTETLLFHDAVDLLTEAINDLSRTGNIETNSINCSNRSVAKNGFNTVLYMKSKKKTQAVTAPLKFDESGNRVAFDIHIIDTLDNKIIATWHAESRSLDLTRSSSETENAIVANLQKTTVIVSSRIGEPYLMYREPEEGKELVGNDRYEGYSMDLIKEIAKIVPFGSFEFHLTADGQYGKFDEKQRKWTGLIGDLLEKRAHLAICDLTITHQRREVVDFSMPFMTLGIGILYRKAEKKDINMFAFLDPFSVPVWICTATLYLVISVVLYFVSRMTPGDWENPHPCDENPEELENIWDIKNCMWLTLGSIMTQGCDILPKGISSRLAVSMWWFFSLILTSSYTANLAAFLTKDRMEPTIDGAEALSKQTKIKYGAVDGGSTQAFFRDSNFTTYQRMWLSMQQARPGVFEKNNADGVARVQSSKGKYAFLMESTQIEYEEETKCDLKKVGGSLDTKSYGIAMPINSPYRSAINKAILKLQEGGVLAELKEKWWKDKREEPSCDKPDSEEADGAELALANIGGVFYVLGIGVAAAFVLAICEFLWNVRTVSVEEHMTFTEALKVELKFACNIWITKKRTKLVVSESSGSSQRSDKTDNALHTSAAYTNISKSS